MKCDRCTPEWLCEEHQYSGLSPAVEEPVIPLCDRCAHEWRQHNDTRPTAPCRLCPCLGYRGRRVPSPAVDKPVDDEPQTSPTEELALAVVRLNERVSELEKRLNER